MHPDAQRRDMLAQHIPPDGMGEMHSKHKGVGPDVPKRVRGVDDLDPKRRAVRFVAWAEGRLLDVALDRLAGVFLCGASDQQSIPPETPRTVTYQVPQPQRGKPRAGRERRAWPCHAGMSASRHRRTQCPDRRPS